MTKKSEKFENGNWTDIEEPPVRSISYYAVVFHAGNFYYFGGRDNTGTHLRSILCLNAASWTWSNVGQLNSGRLAHGVIQVENKFMVLGGDGTKRNEACILSNGYFTCEEKGPSLTWYNLPLVFLVNGTYGNC